MQFENQVVLITGGGGGIGRAAAQRFLSPEDAQGVLEAVAPFHPLNRHGRPSDVTEAILFLAGSGAGWITGTTLPVDGGVLAGRSPAVHAEVEAAA